MTITLASAAVTRGKPAAAGVGREPSTEPLALYIHWPFCVSKCPYCDFNSHVRASIDQEVWRDALLADLAHEAARAPGRKLGSIFFGGGTPSLMPPATVAALIEAAEAHWGFSDGIEITLEANPSSVEAARFADLALAGVNRVSLGLQSLDDRALRFLGRAHDVAEARAALETAQSHFARVSFDLIYALPGQTEGSVDRTVAYCDALIGRFPRGRVVPFLCPMLPFLDPGSDIFEDPARFGYRLFHRTLEEHRAALVAPSWRDRLNYETDALDRDALVRVSYRGVAELTRIKIERGLLPTSLGERLLDLIDETRALMDEIAAVEAMPAGAAREDRWRSCRGRIAAYNDRHVGVVRSQQRPADLGFARRQWFDTDRSIDRVLDG